MNYIRYDKTTGRILATGTCALMDFEKQAMAANEAVLKGVANDRTQKIVDEKVVNESIGEIDPIPELPNLARITQEDWEDIKRRVVVLERT